MAKIKGTNLNFDPEFRFLLDLDPAFQDWKALAAEWWPIYKRNSNSKAGLCAFFVSYLHGLGLDKMPGRLLDAGTSLPDLSTVLKLDSMQENTAKNQYNAVSDFLEWVLREKFAEPDADGHRLILSRLRNPFPRMAVKQTGKMGDLSFHHVLLLDQRMQDWQAYAAEYIQTLRENQAKRSIAVDAFLTRYLLELDLPRDPLVFLRRATPKPPLVDSLLATKGRSGRGIFDASGKPTKTDININNYSVEFIDWVLQEKLSVQGDHGERVVPHEYHNPIERLSKSGIGSPAETVKNALPMLYIRMLREMLAQGKTFRDWAWAQMATDANNGTSDWFTVDPAIVNRDDPDCVWRERNIARRDCRPNIVTELWSPVRAVALYTKLELPLRTHQVRFLDSGEGDTWRYVWDTMGGRFELNDTSLATGSESRPCQRGVFYRQADAKGAGFFINTNKTADINKPEDEKGYVIPWTHTTLLYWLEKLRNWQERYNPIKEAMPWTALDIKHFNGGRPAESILAERSPAFFLFRDPTGNGSDKCKALAHGVMNGVWYKLLERLEQRIAAMKEKDDSGNPVRLVNPEGQGTSFPLHALRVSLITGLIMDGGLPVEVVSKLIAGHHGLIQTIYYTKIGIDHMNKLMADAEQKMSQSEAKSHKVFLMRHARDEINQRFASVSEDGVTAAMNQKSEVGFVVEDKGICPVGCAMCDVGGEKINEAKDRNDHAPVPGYPHERNCVRCRFFLTGPAWLPALNAKFNHIAYQAMQTAERYNRFTEQVAALEERRAECEATGSLFTEAIDLEKMSQRLEAETETLDRWIADLQAVQRLITRSIEIARNGAKDGLQLVAAGTLVDIQTALTVTKSELLPIEVQCRDAVVYPEIDASKPALRRSQLLDVVMNVSKKGMLFSRLNPEEQLLAGNAMMKLIESRAGSMENAVSFVEARGHLKQLGIVDDDLIHALSGSGVEGIAMSDVISDLRNKRTLASPRNKEVTADESES